MPTGGQSVRYVDAVFGVPWKMTFDETAEVRNLSKLAADSARRAGATAHNPLKLLGYAQSAAARDTSSRYNAGLRFAFGEINKLVLLSEYSPLATNLQALTMTDLRTFLWGSFELCCTYLSRPEALKGHSVCGFSFAPIEKDEFT